MNGFDESFAIVESDEAVTLSDLAAICGEVTASEWEQLGLTDYNPQRTLTRLECAVVIDAKADPFNKMDVNIKGEYIR